MFTAVYVVFDYKTGNFRVAFSHCDTPAAFVRVHQRVAFVFALRCTLSLLKWKGAGMSWTSFLDVEFMLMISALQVAREKADVCKFVPSARACHEQTMDTHTAVGVFRMRILPISFIESLREARTHTDRPGCWWSRRANGSGPAFHKTRK